MTNLPNLSRSLIGVSKACRNPVFFAVMTNIWKDLASRSTIRHDEGMDDRRTVGRPPCVKDTGRILADPTAIQSNCERFDALIPYSQFALMSWPVLVRSRAVFARSICANWVGVNFVFFIFC